MERKMRETAAMFGIMAAAGGAEKLNAQQPQEAKKSEQKSGRPGTKRNKKRSLRQCFRLSGKRKSLTILKRKIISSISKRGNKDLFTKLNENHISLMKILDVRLMDLSLDDNSGIADMAGKEWNKFNESVERRKSEIVKSGKKYFDRVARPGGPLLGK